MDVSGRVIGTDVELKRSSFGLYKVDNGYSTCSVPPSEDTVFTAEISR